MVTYTWINLTASSHNLYWFVVTYVVCHPSERDLAKKIHWRHNGRHGVSSHQSHECLLKRLLRHTSKKTSKLRVTGFCEGNSPVTGEFPTQRSSNAENVSIWRRHHENIFSNLWSEIVLLTLFLHLPGVHELRHLLPHCAQTKYIVGKILGTNCRGNSIIFLNPLRPVDA